MIKPAAPANEAARLAALRSYEILDTPPEESFDDIAKLAAHICGTPVALVSLVDEARQWFKARIGVDAPEMDRNISFCAHGILHSELLIVSDATKDARFTDNPLVTGGPCIRFYAGAPLITAGGHALGMVCVVDPQPRTLTPSQSDALRLLARQAVAQLELRKRTRELQNEILERCRIAEERDRFFATSLDLLCICGGDGYFRRVNPAFEKTLGWTSAELLPKPFTDIVHPDDQAAARAQVQRLLTGHSVVEFQIRCLTKDGSYRSIDWTSTAADAAGLFMPCGRDVTDRKRAEEQLRLSEDRFRHAFDDAPIGMALVSREGRWLKVNRALNSMLGYAESEFLATDFQHITHRDDLAKDLELVGQVLAGTILTYQMEKRYFHKKGGIVSVMLSVSLVRNANGDPLYFVAQIENITKRKEAEEALRVSEERLQILTQRLSLAARTAGIGVWDWNVHNNKINWDELMFHIYGTPLDVPITYEHWKTAVMPEDLPAAEGALRQVISEKGRTEMEFRIRRWDGSIRHIHAAMNVALDKDQNVAQVIGINLDITERKQREADREKIIAELQEVIMQVKTLSGLIPICGWCKSIRADTGYWQTVEQYVRSNTGATFSHGICPTCAVNFKDEIRLANAAKAPAPDS